MTSDAPAADMCQCAKAKGDYKTEAELGATVICPDCHLEESTFPEPDNAEQPGLISEKDVYIAFTGSSALLKIAQKHPNDQSIRKAVRKRERVHQGVKDLIRNHGILSVVAAIKVLLDDNVFTCTESASRRFPTLFPKEQILNSEEGQETAAGDSSAKDIEPLDGECNHPNETADGFGESGLQNSQHGQSLQDCRLLASLPTRPRQRLMSQLQLILEHACFAFGQRTMQKDINGWGWTCAEAVPLQRWIDLFKDNRTFETESSTEKLSTLLGSVARIQDIAIQRLSVDLAGAINLLSAAEEFVQLLGTPMYQSSITPLQQQIKRGILTANRSSASIEEEADRKFAEIEAEREKLKRQEEEIKGYQNENLRNIQDSLEHDIFAAMAQAREALPDIGFVDHR